MAKLDLTDTFNVLNNLTKYDSLYIQKCIYLTDALINGQTAIRDIVECLGTLLVHTAVEKRELGTLILSKILDRLPLSFLDSTDLFYIASFYSDRMKDHHEVIPAVLRGVVALMKMKNIPEGSSQKVLRALFDNISCQQQRKEDRQVIYEIFIEFSKRRSAEVQVMGLDFVLGVIQAIDGERDPDNLLLLFRWIPHFLRTVNLRHLTEDMFLILECYFPVDFRAPTQNNRHISREDLANSLCYCLCAIPEFGPFCMPLIIDKLDSSLNIAKLDSMRLLTESCRTFSVDIYVAHFHSLISSLQAEMLHTNDSELEEASSLAITSLIRKLSEVKEGPFFSERVECLYDSLKGHIRPDTKLFAPTIKILLASARGCPESCNILMGSLGALLINQFKITTDVGHQEILFKTLMEFVGIYIQANQVADITAVEMLQEIPTLYLEATAHPKAKMRVLGYEGITQIVECVPQTIRLIIYNLLKTYMTADESRNVREAFLKCFQKTAVAYSAEVLEHILPSTMQGYSHNLELYLELVCTIATEQPFMKIIIPQIMFYCVDSNTSKIACKSLKQLLEDHYADENLQNYLYKNCKIIEVLMSQTIKTIETDEELLGHVADVLKLIIGFQPADEQDNIIRIYLKESLTSFKQNGFIKDNFLIILEGLLLRLRAEVSIPNKFDLVSELVHMSEFVECEIYMHACKLVANMLNKCDEDEQFQGTLTQIQTYIQTNLETNMNELHVTNIIALLTWITKALIVKGSNLSNSWTDQLILLLDRYKSVGKSFRLIMDDRPECLSTKSYCINRFLYRQKFFAYACKKLSTTYNEQKPNYLIALGYLLQLVPQKVLILYFKEALRLLVFCLELCKEPDVLCAVLNTLCTLITSKEAYLENYIEDFVTRFLSLARFQNSMRVRIAALKCIQELAGAYPVYKLLPHTQSVIFGLMPCLDDKKRLVRKQAVEARSAWFLLDSPT